MTHITFVGCAEEWRQFMLGAVARSALEVSQLISDDEVRESYWREYDLEPGAVVSDKDLAAFRALVSQLAFEEQCLEIGLAKQDGA